MMGAMGYVPQDHFLFSMTVRDNIRFAKPDLEQAAVEQAAALAFINQEIKAFPEGYDTMVGERGVSLSGGQNNGFLLHGVIVEPELLILDDALSAVDTKTEEAILSNLKETPRKTTIITAHRLSSVMHANLSVG